MAPNRLSFPPVDRVLPSPFFYGSVSSTNDVLAEKAARGAPEGTVVVADHQSAGRGRRGRAWVSPPVQQGENLLCSLLWRGLLDSRQLGELPFVVGVALYEAISRFAEQELGLTDIPLQVKWPNDLLLAGCKLGGVLIEKGGDDQHPWVIIGTGINLSSSPQLEDSTGLAAQPTTYLYKGGVPEHLSLQAARNKLVFYWQHAWAGASHQWMQDGFAALREAWLERAAGLGQPIVVRLSSGELTGQFQGITPTGALQLVLPNGEEELISCGDVFFLKNVSADRKNVG